MVVKINAIEVAEGRGPELEERFAKRAAEVEGMPGFLGFELLRPAKGETATSSTRAGRPRRRSGPGSRARRSRAATRRRPPTAAGTVAHGAALMEFEVVQKVEPPASTHARHRPDLHISRFRPNRLASLLYTAGKGDRVRILRSRAARTGGVLLLSALVGIGGASVAWAVNANNMVGNPNYDVE